MEMTKISEQFNCVPGTNREKLLEALHRRVGKQVTSADLQKAVYGRSKNASHGALMMIVKGLEGMIKKGRLPFQVKKEKIDGAITLGLHSKKRGA
jgi:hypothetical protein